MTKDKIGVQVVVLSENGIELVFLFQIRGALGQSHDCSKTNNNYQKNMGW